MSAQHPSPDSHHAPPPVSTAGSGSAAARVPDHGHRRGHGHTLMMLVMCAPMVLFVGVLVLTGRATGVSVLGALLCVGMMAAMMGMHQGHDRR